MFKHAARFTAMACLLLGSLPAHALTDLPYLKATTDAVDAYHAALDIQKYSCESVALIPNAVREQNCNEHVNTADKFPWFDFIDRVVSRSREAIANSPAPAEKTLQAMAAAQHFRLAGANAEEALALYDFAINRIFVRYILTALHNVSQRPGFDIASLSAATVGSSNYIGRLIDKEFAPKLAAIAAKVPTGSRLLYISVGCASAEKDMRLIDGLKKQFKGLAITPYCLDPYQQPKGHAFTKAGGMLDNKPLKAGETLLSRAERYIGKKPHVSVVTGHYAFHHTSQSLSAFLAGIGKAPLLLFETYVPDSWFGNSQMRIYKIAVDVVSNYGFDSLHKTSWVRDAFKKPDDFAVYYLSKPLLVYHGAELSNDWIASGAQVIIGRGVPAS